MNSQVNIDADRQLKTQNITRSAARWWQRTVRGVRTVGRRLTVGPDLYSRRVGVGLAAGGAAAAVFGWFQNGRHIATGDVSPFIHHNMATELGLLWNHAQSGAGSVTYMIARAYQVWLEQAVGWAGGSSATAQQIYFTVLAAAAAGGVAYLVAALVRRPAAIWAAGMFTVINPFLLTRMPNALILYALALGGAAGGILIRSGRGVMRFGGLKLGLLGLAAAPLAYNPPMLAVLAVTIFYLAGVAVVVGRPGAAKRLAKTMITAAPIAVVVNLWWLVALYYTLFGGLGGVEVAAVTDVTSWQWTHQQNSLQAVFSMTAHHGWGMAQYYPATVTYNGLLGYAVYLIPTVVCSSWILLRRRRMRAMAWIAAASIGVLVFLSKGLHAPWAEANLWLYENVPGFWLLREPSGKLGPLLVTIYAMGLGVVLDQLWRRAGGRKVLEGGMRVRNPLRRAVAGLRKGQLTRGQLRKDQLRTGEARVRSWAAVTICAVGLVAGWPLVTGAVIPEQRPIFPSGHVEVPHAWYEVADLINAETGLYNPGEGSKVLTLPVNDYYQMPTTWGYYGVDTIPASLLTSPLVNHQPGGYYGEQLGYQAALNAVTAAVYDGDREQFEQLAGRLGVSHVVVRKDIDYRMVAGRSFADPEVLAVGVAEMGFQPVYSNEVAEVYRIGDGGKLQVYDQAVVGDQEVVGNEEALRLGLSRLNAKTVLISGPENNSIEEVEAGLSDAGVRVAGRMTVVSEPTNPLGQKEDWSESQKERQLIWAGQAGSHLEVTAEDGKVRVNGGALDGETGDLLVAFDRDRVPKAVATVGEVEKMWTPNLSTLAVYETEMLNSSTTTTCEEGVCEWQLNLNPRADQAQQTKVGSERAVLVTVIGEPTNQEAGVSSPCVQTGWSGRTERTTEACWQLTPVDGEERGSFRQHRRWLAVEDPALGVLGATRVSVQVRGMAAGAVSIERLVPREGEVQVGRPTRTAGEAPYTAAGKVRNEEKPNLPRIDGKVILGELGQLSDCNKVDDAGPAETGLVLRETPTGWLLGADRHSACVGVEFEVVGEVPVIEVELDVTRVKGGDGRVCVYSAQLRRCLPGPTVTQMNTGTGETTRYRASFVRPAGERRFELFTYADSEQVAGRTEVAYENLKVRPSGGQLMIEVSESPAENNAENSPERRTAQVVVLEESYSKGWVLETPAGEEVAAVHVLADGWANGWVLAEDPEQTGYDPGSLVVRFSPQRHADQAVDASLAALAIIGLAAVVGRRRLQRKR